jgi:hypothetical protein
VRRATDVAICEWCVTYYFRNVVVGRASFTRLDKRDEAREGERAKEKKKKKKKKREEEVGVPLAATIVAVAMADTKSIGWTFLFSLSACSARPRGRNEKNYEMFMTDSFSDVKRGLFIVVESSSARLLTYVPSRSPLALALCLSLPSCRSCVACSPTSPSPSPSTPFDV